jgi:hypothetical protein
MRNRVRERERARRWNKKRVRIWQRRWSREEMDDKSKHRWRGERARQSEE